MIVQDILYFSGARMPAMLMTLKVRLKVRKTAGKKLRRAMGCARFVHNFLLSETKSDYEDWTKSDYEDWLEEKGSRLIYGEAFSPEEAEALCIRPEAVGKYSFNYRLKLLKKQYPFPVTDAPAQILQQECRRPAGACKRFFEGKGGYPRFKRIRALSAGGRPPEASATRSSCA